MILIDYLNEKINKSKNTIKNILASGNVYVNGKSITKYNYELKENDLVEIRNSYNNIDIIYEDKDIIVVNKPHNLLTVSTLKEKEKTLFHIMSEYVKKSNKNNKIFIVHRLDKDTSGLIVLAKSMKVKELLQKNWDNTIREYVAIVEGKTKDKDIIKSYIKDDLNKPKLAITEYNKIKENESYTMLNINIKTGRKNQIRIHMKEMGNPILGDTKFGHKSNRMYLHAYRLRINDKYDFKIDIPFSFKKIVKKG